MPNPFAPMQALKPYAPLDLSGLGRASRERQRLELERDRLEQQRKQWDERMELQKLKIQADQTQQALKQQQAQKEFELEQQKLNEQRRFDAQSKFAELVGQQRYQEARAMVPQMTQLGMQVELLGEDPETGLPTWRVEANPEAAQSERR